MTARRGGAGVTRRRRGPQRRWRPDEDELLVRHYEQQGPQWCAQQLGRTVPAVRQRVVILGVGCDAVEQPLRYRGTGHDPDTYKRQAALRTWRVPAPLRRWRTTTG